MGKVVSPRQLGTSWLALRPSSAASLRFSFGLDAGQVREHQVWRKPYFLSLLGLGETEITHWGIVYGLVFDM